MLSVWQVGLSQRGLCLGRGLARFNGVRLSGPKVRRIRARCSDPGDGALVDLYRDHSVAPLVDLRRRLRAVLDVIAAIGRSGFTVSRGLELIRQWGSIVAGGPRDTVTAEALARVAGLGLADMEASVTDLHHGLDRCLQSVVRHRREKACGKLGSWRTPLHVFIGNFGLILFLLLFSWSVILEILLVGLVLLMTLLLLMLS